MDCGRFVRFCPGNHLRCIYLLQIYWAGKWITDCVEKVMVWMSALISSHHTAGLARPLFEKWSPWLHVPMFQAWCCFLEYLAWFRKLWKVTSYCLSSMPKKNLIRIGISNKGKIPGRPGISSLYDPQHKALEILAFRKWKALGMVWTLGKGL